MFGLLHCTKLQKTLFTAQLCGSASPWWPTYTTAIQDNHQVPWSEFCTTFHEHHLPEGTMHLNLWEFLDLQQGTDNVYGYIKRFNYLAQYDPYHVVTDEKKADLFREGLSLPLQDRLVRLHDLSINALVNATIKQEGTYRDVLDEEEKMRKRALSGPSEDSTRGAPSNYRLVYTPSASKSQVPPPPPQWDHHPPQQQQQVLPQMPIQSPQPVSPPAPQRKTTIVSTPCFNCGHVGHFTGQCPEP
jgi:hypothetical protein